VILGVPAIDIELNYLEGNMIRQLTGLAVLALIVIVILLLLKVI
jgi:hypothetical protein